MMGLRRWVAVSALTAYMGAVAMPAAQAAMVDAGSTIPAASTIDAQLLNEALDRDSVRAALERHGVNPELARERVNALTDEELATLSHKYGELPAGGAFVEALIIGFLVWAVLHATDYGGIFMGDEEQKAQ